MGADKTLGLKISIMGNPTDNIYLIIGMVDFGMGGKWPIGVFTVDETGQFRDWF